MSFKVEKIEKVNKTQQSKPITVRFPEDVYNEYKKLSKETNQSFNSIIISALRYCLDNMKEAE